MLTQDPARAEDLVQQTVLRAFEKADQLTSQADYRSWLFSILRNFHRMSLRHEGTVSERTAGDGVFVTLEAELYPPPLTPEALVEQELTISWPGASSRSSPPSGCAPSRARTARWPLPRYATWRVTACRTADPGEPRRSWR